MKSGFIALVGRPNVGKSTLLNAIMGKKVAITSNKPQTTRNLIQGIYNDDDSQMVFVDTPGIHKPQNKLGKFLNKQAYMTVGDVDVILFRKDYDDCGKIAKRGRVVEEVLQELLNDPYLYQLPPKSTGREKYNDALLSEIILKVLYISSNFKLEIQNSVLFIL